MVYSKLIKAKDKNHIEIALQEIEKEKRQTDQRISVYLSDNSDVPEDVFQDGVFRLSASQVMLPDVFSVILTFNTLRSSRIVHTPKDVLIIIPECDRYLRLVPIDLLRTVIGQLMYMGVRLFLITSGDTLDEDIFFDEVVTA